MNASTYHATETRHRARSSAELVRAVIISLGVPWACGVDDRNVGVTEEALSPDVVATEASVETPAVCTAADLTAICEGAWRYRRWASCSVSDVGPVTPVTCLRTPACSVWKACEDWSFGTMPRTETKTFQHEVSTCRTPGCFRACDEEATNIQAAQAALRDGVPPQFREQVSIVQQVETVISSRSYSPGFLEDDKFDEIRECTVTFEYPTPASGQGETCGCATFECTSPACGADPNDVISPVGLTLAALREQDPNVADTFAPSCSTCDALQIEGSGD